MHRLGLPLGLRALGELLRALAELQLAHDLPGQSGEGLLLFLADMAGMTVEHAEGADRMAIGSEEWNSCIETNERLSRDHRMIRESTISQGIGKHDGVRLHDGMGAERAISRQFGVGDSDAGFEPEAGSIHEADVGHGCSADLCCELAQVVEGRLSFGIQDAIAQQSVVASVFILRLHERLHHARWHPVTHAMVPFVRP